MKENNQIIDNIKQSKYWLSIANFIAGIIFIVTYYYTQQILILIFAIILIILSIFVFFYFSHLEIKYKDKFSGK